MSLLILLFSLLSFAQDKSFQYQMDGSFEAQLPGLSESKTIRFNLLWNEKNGQINGRYQDDFFIAGSSVSGVSGVSGKVFQLDLPEVRQNIKRLFLTTSSFMPNSTPQPIMISMRDQFNMTVAESNSLVSTFEKMDYVPEVEKCSSGFGALKGFCGLYKGRLVEEEDPESLCQLPDYGFRLELNEDAQIFLYFYYSDSLIGIPHHDLGLLLNAPATKSIQLTTRHCGNLVGTTIPHTNCQTLNLTGEFSDLFNQKSFRGNYIIRDDQTNAGCRYSLNLTKEE
jgi:hypothetical protein